MGDDISQVDAVPEESFVPKLRRNRRLECRWGLNYFMNLKNIVFNLRNDPFVPAPLPRNVAGDTDEYESRYTCQQCGDCFRFMSSLEDHTARRSWILGYWCGNCFFVECPHKTADQVRCSNCVHLELYKRRSLKAKGCRKGQKVGSVNIFFNQCQFFAHLREHRTKNVDMSDIMLMPMPVDVPEEEYPDLKRACGIVMERMFLKRTHVMDWLRVHQLGDKWWQNFNSNSETFLNRIFPTVQPVETVKPNKESPSAFYQTACAFGSSNLTDTIDSVATNSCRGNVESREFDDYTSADDELRPTDDIAFVDCGSAAKVCSPEVSIILPPKTSIENSPKRNFPAILRNSVARAKQTSNNEKNNDFKPKITVKRFANEHGSATDATKAVPATCRAPSKEIPGNKSSSDSEATVIDLTGGESVLKKSSVPGKPAPRILTVQSSKHADLSKILGRLPASVINGKKILFIGPNSEPLTMLPKGVTPGHNMIQIRSEIDRSIIKLTPSPETNCRVRLESGTKPKIDPNSKTKTVNLPSNIQKIALDGKVISRNGKKFIVRQTANPNNLGSLKLKTVSRQVHAPFFASKSNATNAPVVPIHPKSRDDTDVALPPTPSPSLSDNSNGSTSEQPSSRVSSIESRTASAVFWNSPTDNSPAGSSQTTKIIASEKPSAGCESPTDSFKAAMETKTLKVAKCQTWSLVATKYKQRMLNSLILMSERVLRKRIDHTISVNENYAEEMGSRNKSVVSKNTEAIKLLQNALKTASRNGETNTDDVLSEIAATQPSEEAKRCVTCGKLVRSALYLLSVSNPSSHENCHCQNYICHLCHVFQGSLSRWSAHLNFHDKKKPFSCPECFRKFPDYERLEIHIWTMCFHPLARRWFSCRVCDVEGFQDTESIAKHFMLSHTNLKMTCPICKTFVASKTAMQLHQEQHHPFVSGTVRPTYLVACTIGHCVVPFESYKTHLTNHAGILKVTCYKCPFCDFFTKDADSGKELIKSHLFDEHLDRFSELVGSAHLVQSIVVRLTKERAKKISVKSNIDADTNGAIIDYGPYVGSVSEGNENASADTPTRTSSQDVEIKSASDEDKLPKIVDVRSILPGAYGDLDEETGQCSPDSTTVLEKGSREKDESASRTRILEVVLDDSLDSDYPEHATAGNPASATSILESVRDKLRILESGRVDGKSSPEEERNGNDPKYFGKGDVSSRLEEEVSDRRGRPPPLARISQLDEAPVRFGRKDGSIDDTVRVKSKKKRIRRRRIALNGPTKGSEIVEFSCHMCAEKINTFWPVIRRHFESKHSTECELFAVTPRLTRISDEFVAEGYKHPPGMKKRKSDASPPNSKKRKRWSQKKRTENRDSLDLGMCVEPESVQDCEGNFKCKKCEHSCNNISKLRSHIAATHRLKDHYLMCLECGENFVVEPSLRMHLKAFHGIQDPEAHMRLNEIYIREIRGNGDIEPSTGIPNQCHVCKAVFEDKSAVDKHLRVHGMAFLNRKRMEARNAAMNPEKKIKLDAPEVEPSVTSVTSEKSECDSSEVKKAETVL